MMPLKLIATVASINQIRWLIHKMLKPLSPPRSKVINAHVPFASVLLVVAVAVNATKETVFGYLYSIGSIAIC